MAKFIGLDITSDTLSIYEPGEGVTFSEENCACVDIVSREVLAVGRAARTLADNTPGAVDLINGIYSATSINKEMVAMNIAQAFHAIRIKKPSVIIARRKDEKPEMIISLANMLFESGAREVFTVDTMSACSLGSGVLVSDKRCMIACDIEDDFTVIALMKGCVNKASKTLPFSIEKLLEVITTYVKNEKSAVITRDTAKSILEYSVSTKPQFEYEGCNFIGKNIITGLPVGLNLDSEQIKALIAPYIKYLCDNIKLLYDGLSPDIRLQVEDKGLLLSGNSYFATLLKYYIEETTGLHVSISENGKFSSLMGIGEIIEHIDVFDVLLKKLTDE